MARLRVLRGRAVVVLPVIFDKEEQSSQWRPSITTSAAET